MVSIILAVTPEEIESFFREVTEIASLFLHAQANYEEAKKALRDDEVIELYEDPTVTVCLNLLFECTGQTIFVLGFS